jgi:hypothetical protein
MGIGSVSRRYRDGPTAGLPSLRVKFRLFCHGRLQCVRNRPFSSPKTRHNQTEPLPKRRVSLIDHRFDDLVGAAGSFGYLSVTLPPALEFWPWPLERRRGLFPLVQTQCPLPEILTNASGGLASSSAAAFRPFASFRASLRFQDSGSVTLPTCAHVTLLTARLFSQGRRQRASAEAYLSPLRQTTFFHSGLCRWKAKLVGFSVDRRHGTAEFESYFIWWPIGHQELPKCFLFVVSPTIGIFRHEWISLLRMEYTTVDGCKCIGNAS